MPSKLILGIALYALFIAISKVSPKALGETLEIAINNAYNAIPKINFEGMFFRSDIGKKGLKND